MPMPTDDKEQARVVHSRLRRNIQEGTWEMEILWRMKEQYGLNQVNNMGRPSMSVNLLNSYVDQIALLWDSPSSVSNDAMPPGSPAELVWTDLVETTHLCALEQEMNRKLVAMRECMFFVQATEAGLQLKVITPDEFCVDATTGDTSHPTAIRWSRVFEVINEKGEIDKIDAWERWDISDPDAPVHEVVDGEGKNLTLVVYPDDTGVYPYTDDAGPYLPWAFYRARYTSDTFDPYWGSELIHGTLDIAIHWTMWGVCLRNNSWPQWWMMDADVPGTGIADQINGPLPNPPDTIELAPNSILRIKSHDGAGGKVGQLQPADAKTMGESILAKQATILNNVGIHPADVEQSSSPQSGVSIQLKRSAQRKQALSYIPTYRDADQRFFGLLARMHNQFYGDESGTNLLPTEGWRVDYQLPEMSTDEFLVDLGRDVQLVAMGLRSKVDLAAKLFDCSPEEARQKLDDVARMNALYPMTATDIGMVAGATSRRTAPTN